MQFRQSIRCTPLIPERHFGFWAKHLAANGWVVPDRAHPRDPALNDDEWLLDAMTRAMDKVLKEGLDIRQRNPRPSVGVCQGWLTDPAPASPATPTAAP